MGLLLYFLFTMSHTSYTSSAQTTSSIDERAKANYIRIAELIRQYGTPNAQFPSDKDIRFEDLRAHFDIGGLGTIIKNMKQKKMVDYRDPLVEDYYTEFNPQGITYDEILLKIEGDKSSHCRSVAAEENAADASSA